MITSKVLTALSDSYGIPIDNAYNLLCGSISRAMRLLNSNDYDCYIMEGAIILRKYTTFGNYIDIFFDQISYESKTFIKKEVIKFFKYYNNINEFDRIKSIRNGLIWATIIKIMESCVYAEFIDTQGYTLIGVMHKSDYMKEKYHIGMNLAFFCKNVEISEKYEDDARVQITLSRVSTKLPELLMKNKINEYGLIVGTIVCAQRKIGKISVIFVDKEIPRYIISDVSEELNREYIKVCLLTASEIRQIKKSIISWEQLAQIHMNLWKRKKRRLQFEFSKRKNK